MSRRNNGWMDAARRGRERRYFDVVPVQPSHFEKLCDRLGLDEYRCMESEVMCNWIRENFTRRYVPERVLIAMGLAERLDA